MHASAPSEVFWEVVECFLQAKGNLVTDLREGTLTVRAELYLDSVKMTGAPLTSCVGFIDNTKIRLTRPGGHSSYRSRCYSGHKRIHCLMSQIITAPYGLIFPLYGPEVGRRHDVNLLSESGIEERLENCLLIIERQFYLYVDAAYMLRP